MIQHHAPITMKLEQNERLRNFGIFSKSRYSSRYKDDVTEEVDMFVEKVIQEMDKKFLEKDWNKYYSDLLYSFSAMLSVLRDPTNSINKQKSMPQKVYKIWSLIHKIVADRTYSESHLIDHVFWYYTEPDPLNGGNKTFYKNRYLVFESHPYFTLNNYDFKHIADILGKYGDFLTIEIKPGSHYFIDRTLYIRFIVDTTHLPSDLDDIVRGYCI
jgi:hypothetical protein